MKKIKMAKALSSSTLALLCETAFKCNQYRFYCSHMLLSYKILQYISYTGVFLAENGLLGGVAAHISTFNRHIFSPKKSSECVFLYLIESYSFSDYLIRRDVCYARVI